MLSHIKNKLNYQTENLIKIIKVLGEVPNCLCLLNFFMFTQAKSFMAALYFALGIHI